MKILYNTDIQHKTMNSFKEWLRFYNNLIKEGHIFIKKIIRANQRQSAIYLPKRLEGKTFRVILVPIDDYYETETAQTEKKIEEKPKEQEKTAQTKRINLLDIK